MGYNFVTFPAFCIWWEIHSWLGEAGLANRFTPRDVLRKFAAVKVYYTCKGPFVTDIPKDVSDLGDRIGIKLDLGYIPQIS